VQAIRSTRPAGSVGYVIGAIERDAPAGPLRHRRDAILSGFRWSENRQAGHSDVRGYRTAGRAHIDGGETSKVDDYRTCTIPRRIAIATARVRSRTSSFSKRFLR